jgi:hypothetical protein
VTPVFPSRICSSAISGWRSQQFVIRKMPNRGPHGRSAKRLNVRGGLAAPARAHGQAEADGQRGEDANLQSAGRRVHLPGLLVRADVFSENRKSVPGVPAIDKEHQAHGRERPCADDPIVDLARDHRAGRQVEPHDTRMGELLRSRRHLHYLFCSQRAAPSPTTENGPQKAG